jgi:hypothetical protein
VVTDPVGPPWRRTYDVDIEPVQQLMELYRSSGYDVSHGLAVDALLVGAIVSVVCGVASSALPIRKAVRP